MRGIWKLVYNALEFGFNIGYEKSGGSRKKSKNNMRHHFSFIVSALTVSQARLR